MAFQNNQPVTVAEQREMEVKGNLTLHIHAPEFGILAGLKVKVQAVDLDQAQLLLDIMVQGDKQCTNQYDIVGEWTSTVQLFSKK